MLCQNRFYWIFDLKELIKARPSQKILGFFRILIDLNNVTVFDIGANIFLRRAILRELGGLVLASGRPQY